MLPRIKARGFLDYIQGHPPTPYRMGYSYSFQNLPFLEVPDKLRTSQTEGQHLDLKKRNVSSISNMTVFTKKTEKNLKKSSPKKIKKLILKLGIIK